MGSPRPRWWDGPEVDVPASGMANDTVLFRSTANRSSPASRLRRALCSRRSRPRPRVPAAGDGARAVAHVGAGPRGRPGGDVDGVARRAVHGDARRRRRRPLRQPAVPVDPGAGSCRARPSEWKRLETSTIDVLVQLHRVVDDGDATAFLPPGRARRHRAGAPARSHRDYYEWARTATRSRSSSGRSRS